MEKLTAHQKIKTFFGIPLPAEIQDNIDQQIKTIFSDSKYESIRWTKKENLHVTLTFLGEISAEKCRAVIEETHQLLNQKVRSFTVEWKNILVLPSIRHPHVIALTPSSVDQEDQLKQLESYVHAAADNCGIALEEREYLPHLTIGRVKKKLYLDEQFDRLCFVPFTLRVDKVNLFQSRPIEGGVEYAVSEEFDLGIRTK